MLISTFCFYFQNFFFIFNLAYNFCFGHVWDENCDLVCVCFLSILVAEVYLDMKFDKRFRVLCVCVCVCGP